MRKNNNRQAARSLAGNAPRAAKLIGPDGKPAARRGLPPWAKSSAKPLIAVFGSSRALPGVSLYEQGYELGHLLGKAGFNVVTGGYRGVMEAVSRGAHDAGARVIGVTMKAFAEDVNPYVMDEISTNDFYQRLRWLVDRAHGYIVMPGGMGTLAEMTFTWQKLWLKMLPPRPFVIVGAAWHKVLDCWLENLVVERGDYHCLTMVDTPQQACERMRSFFVRQHPALAGAASG